MTPYAMAKEAWDSQGEGEPEWEEMLVHFLTTPGHALVNVPDAFILARQLRADLPDRVHRHLSPLQYQGPPDCWNVWLAAGNLDALLIVAAAHPLEWVSYNRRAKHQVRRVKLHRFLRHEPKDSQAPASTASSSTACIKHRRGSRKERS